MSSVVYFIEALGVDRVKIGWTKDLGLRLKDFITACPVDLDVLFTLPGGAVEENALHMQFRHARVRGEWFILSAIESELRALYEKRTVEAFVPRCSDCNLPKRGARKGRARPDKLIDRRCRACSRKARSQQPEAIEKYYCCVCRAEISKNTAKQRTGPLMCRSCAMREAWKDPEYARLRSESRKRNRAVRLENSPRRI